jgi:Na+-translocating ferredoxin:NAD+ oxidoreductase RnfG subunit
MLRQCLWGSTSLTKHIVVDNQPKLDLTLSFVALISVLLVTAVQQFIQTRICKHEEKFQS